MRTVRMSLFLVLVSILWFLSLLDIFFSFVIMLYTTVSSCLSGFLSFGRLMIRGVFVCSIFVYFKKYTLRAFFGDGNGLERTMKTRCDDGGNDNGQ